MTTSTTSTQINDLRAKVLAGETVSVEEYILLITALRLQRSGDIDAAQAKSPTGKRALTAAPAVQLPSFFDGLK